jgi:Lon-like ATP-dependent protease
MGKLKKSKHISKKVVNVTYKSGKAVSGKIMSDKSHETAESSSDVTDSDISSLNITSTKDITLPKALIDQVIGQEEAVEVIKKAATQRRHVLLIGEPGTGKSMLGLALAELLPKEKLVDIICYPNPDDENKPLVKTVPAGKGRIEILQSKIDGSRMFKNQNFLMFVLAVVAMIAPWWILKTYEQKLGATAAAIMFTAFFIGGMFFLIAFVMFVSFGKRVSAGRNGDRPKLIVDNFSKDMVPFYDATGAHAGALLGDVLHDPFQCFSDNCLYLSDSNVMRKKSFKILFEHYWKLPLHKETKNERNYEATFFPKNELFVLGENNNSVSPVEVLSSNRHDYHGEMLKLTTSENKEIVVTPEHKIAVWVNGMIAYVEAQNIKEGIEVVSKAEDIIIDEQDIINTYDEKQQEQCRLYFQYLDIKQKNPSWGYKRIAKAMGQNIGKTRWWYASKHIPVPIQAVNWLKQRGLLPLNIDNPKLPLIAKVIGATFGDGGIFENLNGIFLSSSEKEAVKEFGNDLKYIFNLQEDEKEDENSRIIEAGEYGHSWCYQNTNRNIIRFFTALGAPQGNKTKKELHIPEWVCLLRIIEEEFFGSLFGSELGVPKIHKHKNRLQTFDLAITGPIWLKENRYNFLNEVNKYLERKGIICTSIIKRKTANKDLDLYRLLISVKFENVVNFMTQCKINYCFYKKQKLIKAMNEFSSLKRSKYNDLIMRGYGAEHVMKMLQLSPSTLYLLHNYENFDNVFEAES